MEPDDQDIQAKVRDWEAQPYPVDKDRLWSRYPRVPLRQERSLWYYYAAASLLIAVSLVYYGISETERGKTMLRIREAELAILTARKTVPETITVSPCPELPPVRERTSALRTATRARTPAQIAAARDTVAKEVKLVAVAFPPDTLTLSVVATEATTQRQKPKVILGTVSASNTTPGHEPRLRIKLFKNEEERTPSEIRTSPTVILAGINN